MARHFVYELNYTNNNNRTHPYSQSCVDVMLCRRTTMSDVLVSWMVSVWCRGIKIKSVQHKLAHVGERTWAGERFHQIYRREVFPCQLVHVVQASTDTRP